jgi:hypothetical protein
MARRHFIIKSARDGETKTPEFAAEHPFETYKCSIYPYKKKLNDILDELTKTSTGDSKAARMVRKVLEDIGKLKVDDISEEE